MNHTMSREITACVLPSRFISRLYVGSGSAFTDRARIHFLRKKKIKKKKWHQPQKSNFDIFVRPDIFSRFVLAPRMTGCKTPSILSILYLHPANTDSRKQVYSFIPHRDAFTQYVHDYKCESC